MKSSKQTNKQKCQHVRTWLACIHFSDIRIVKQIFLLLLLLFKLYHYLFAMSFIFSVFPFLVFVFRFIYRSCLSLLGRSDCRFVVAAVFRLSNLISLFINVLFEGLCHILHSNVYTLTTKLNLRTDNFYCANWKWKAEWMKNNTTARTDPIWNTTTNLKWRKRDDCKSNSNAIFLSQIVILSRCIYFKHMQRCNLWIK